MTVAFVEAHRADYGVEPICRELAIAPSTFYRHRTHHVDPTTRSDRAQRDDGLRVETQRVWDAHHQVYRPRKVWKQLRRDGIAVARCTMQRLMREMGLVGVVRGRAWTTTTLPDTAATRPPDLVERTFTAERPNQLWVSDFTYVATWHGFVYVAFVIDVFARRIVGWRVSASLKTDFVWMHSSKPSTPGVGRPSRAWCITAIGAPSTSRCATPIGWLMKGSRPRSAAGATRTTMRSPRPSLDSSRPRSFTDEARRVRSRPWNSRR